MRVSIVKRVEELEARLKPSGLESRPFDFDLLTACEKEYFSLEMRVLRLRARELGYGDKNNKVNWFDLRHCDPVFDEEIRAECFAALNAEEAKVLETFNSILEKGLRLTIVLSDDEKADVKRYNDIVMHFQGSIITDFFPDVYSREDLITARQRYEEIMNKHGETIYERPLITEIWSTPTTSKPLRFENH